MYLAYTKKTSDRCQNDRPAMGIGYRVYKMGIWSGNFQVTGSGVILVLRPAYETSLQSNAASHWLGTSLESTLLKCKKQKCQVNMP